MLSYYDAAAFRNDRSCKWSWQLGSKYIFLQLETNLYFRTYIHIFCLKKNIQNLFQNDGSHKWSWQLGSKIHFLPLFHFLSKSLKSLSFTLSFSLSFSLSTSLSLSLLQMKLTTWLETHFLAKVGSFNYAIDKMVFHDVFLPEKENAMKSVLDYDITINRLK